MHTLHRMPHFAAHSCCYVAFFPRHTYLHCKRHQVMQQLVQQPALHQLSRNSCRRTYRGYTTQTGTVCALSASGSPHTTDTSGMQSSGNEAVLLWFKHDLRLDDHPGLQQAIQSGRSIVPAFCFDPRQCLHLLRLPQGLKGLLGAVKALRESLQQLGSNLLVLTGDMEDVIPQAAALHGASSIILEEEVEYKWHKAVDKVKAALPSGTSLQPWRLQIFGQQPYPQDYNAFKKQRGKAQPPFDRPEKLLALPAGLEVGELPSVEELKVAIKAAFEGKQTTEVAAAFDDLPTSQGWLSGVAWKLCEGEPAAQAALFQYLQCAETPADSASNKDLLTAVLSSEVPATPLGSFPAIFNQALALGTISRRRVYHEAQQQRAKQKKGRRWGATAGSKLKFDVPSRSAAATAEVSDFHWHLAASDRIRDTKTGDAPRHWRWRGFITDYYTAEAPAALSTSSSSQSAGTPLSDADETNTLMQALPSGAASQFSDYAEEQQPDGNAHSSGQPLGSSETQASGSHSPDSADGQLSEGNANGTAQQPPGNGTKEDARSAEQQSSDRGAMQAFGNVEQQPSDSAAEGRQPRSDAPAFLLVHGFGAFGEQWRGQIKALTAAGYQVYAPTFPGYGRSEKQSLAYSQELWRDFLRDFVLEVVQRPVVVAGNSIGGFISASLAADYPTLVKGLVLLNSAGNVNANYTPPAITSTQPEAPGKGPPKLLVDAASQGLFLFLRTSVARTLTRLYPVAPDNADEWLGQEILRAAGDPGALGVFRSVFYLPKPRPLNYLVQDMFGGPTLVLQGAKDPLSNAKDRARQLKAACRNVEVELLDAGHCPHDEVPHVVNRALLDFMQQNANNQSSAAQTDMLEAVSVP